MASPSGAQRPRNHVVFLSFRGKDTRMGFTGHLYDALTRQGIGSFRDDHNLRSGDQIRPELLEAVAASKFAIVVLSSGYATSTWCLEEVAYIVDCMENMDLIVVPVFYHVDPSDVRYQRNSFEQAFAKRETSHRFAPEKLETWRAALRKVGDMKGVHVQGTRLRGLKIIIVLDDVNNREQLKFLAGEREWFGRGSRIIITTTNEDLLTVHKVDGKYKCEGLNFSDSSRLFNLSAFPEGQPKHGYEKLSSDIVELAGGLPLALNAFGSLLFGKEEEYWRETLEKLQQCPEEEVLQRLEICYARLDRNEQDIFIYIACFLKGRDHALANEILKNIGLFPVRGMDILINRSLITIDYDETVWMHDLLQQMAWEVLRRKFPRMPGKPTGLKCRQDIVDVCTSKMKGTEAIEIINQEHYGVEVENCTGDSKSFSKLKKLKFLRISNVLFPHGLKYLSNELRILEWCGCSLKCFPPTFQPKQIYELDMRSSRLEKLWEKDIQDLPNLRSINLCGSEDLTEIPDLTSTPNLEKLNLEGCTNLVELHKSLLAHKRLRYMNLKGCRNLRSLGNSMEMDGLEALLLSGCSKLEHIPEFGENMKKLEHLYLDGTKIMRLPESLGKMQSLRKLDASETDIVELPSFILHLERLRLLHIRRCCLLSLTRTFHSLELSLGGLKELVLSDCNLSAVPYSIGLLYSLKELDLSKNYFVTLPASISLLSNLRMLCLNCCTRLESLPKLPKVNEDTLYGLEIRFSHYISGEGLDVSKFHLSSHGINPTVSCLNCPKLIEDQSDNSLADTIVEKYLQVRTERRVIPEAIFEIVSAGYEIPRQFMLGRSHFANLRGTETGHQGSRAVFYVDFDTCIGVAFFAVIVVPHSLDNTRGVKYEVVAHIHVVGKNSRIRVPINLLEAGLDIQLVWYWTVTDDLRRRVDPSQVHQVDISFSVEPEDGNLEAKKFGVRFLRREDILELRGLRFSINEIQRVIDVISSFRCVIYWYRRVMEANQELRSLNLSFRDHTWKVITILASGLKHRSMSLDSLREVIESLLEMRQDVLKVILECKEETCKDKQLFSLAQWISEGILNLCTGLMKFVEGTSDSWLVVQVAMQQIEAKRRAGTLNYLQTMQQLIGLEAAAVPFLKDDVTTHSFRVVLESMRFYGVQDMKSKSIKPWHKLTIAATFTAVLVYAVMALRIAEPRPTMTTIDHVMTWIGDCEYFYLDKYMTKSIHDWENFYLDMKISDFDGIQKLQEELKGKLGWALRYFDFVTKEDKDEIVIVMDKIIKKISGFTNIVKDMSNHAYKCMKDIGQASTEVLKAKGPVSV